MSASKKTGLARLLEIAGTKQWLLLGSALLVVLHAVLTMIPYILVFYILQQLLSASLEAATVTTYLYWASGAVVVSFVAMFLSGAFSHLAAFNILFELRKKIVEQLGRLPLGYLDQRSSGGLKKILADDVERIESFVAHGIPDVVKACVLPLLILGYLFTVNWQLALVSLLPLVVLIVSIPLLMNTEEVKKAMNRYHRSLEEMNAGIVEYVRAIPVMKIFGQTATAFKKYSGTVNGFQHFFSEWTKIYAPAMGMVISFLHNALLPVLVLGLLLYFEQQLSLAVLVLFLILGVGYVKPLFALASLLNELSMIDHGVKRIDEILFDVPVPAAGHRQLTADYSLYFEDVTFAYRPGLPVLEDVSFSVPQGSITALVGPSGSGKSTLAKLVPRFYELERGRIRIGQTGVDELAATALMDQVSFVFQDNMMFYDTLYNNVLMGMDKSREEVIAACKVARCHDFISQLPEGYETHFGDRGIHLSGGEQQRIQLARVVLKDAPILLLDEATAYADPESERLIMTAFNEIIQNKTVIVIAHRLSTITEADQIVVLRGGRVESTGRHAELLEKSELYQHLWRAHTRAREFEIKR
ncbi:MAG: ABC transporter ATP-binding protein [Bacteroidota bacterium]